MTAVRRQIIVVLLVLAIVLVLLSEQVPPRDETSNVIDFPKKTTYRKAV